MQSQNNINLDVMKKLQDALSAEYIYTEKIDFYEKLIFTYNLLCFCIPLIVLTSLYITKGNENLEPLLNTISTIASVGLLIFMGILYLSSIPDKKEKFIVSRRINRRTQKDCKDNLEKTNEELSFFLKHINDIDDDDLDRLGKLRESTRKASYRYALENLGYDATCPKCKKSPDAYSRFFVGPSCKQCGIEK